MASTNIKRLRTFRFTEATWRQLEEITYALALPSKTAAVAIMASYCRDILKDPKQYSCSDLVNYQLDREAQRYLAAQRRTR